MAEPAPNPYAPPVAAAVAEPEVSLPHVQATLVMLLTGLLLLQAGVAGAKAVACVALNLVTFDFQTEESVVEATNYLATAGIWLYFTTMVPFGVFLVRANRNARAISDGVMYFTPASMVWWYAVPIFSLFKPYQAVREVWVHSMPSAQFERGLPIDHSLLGWWWGAWLASSLVAKISSMILAGAEPVTHNAIMAFENTLSATLCLLALQLVRRLDRLQRECVR